MYLRFICRTRMTNFTLALNESCICLLVDYIRSSSHLSTFSSPLLTMFWSLTVTFGPFKVIFDQNIIVFIYNLAYFTKTMNKKKGKATFYDNFFNSDQCKNLRLNNFYVNIVKNMWIFQVRILPCLKAHATSVVHFLFICVLVQAIDFNEI